MLRLRMHWSVYDGCRSESYNTKDRKEYPVCDLYGGSDAAIYISQPNLHKESDIQMDTGSESGLSRPDDEVDYIRENYMNTSDARAMVQIMSTADGGCPNCVHDLLEIFLKHYIGFFRFEVYNWVEEVDAGLAKALRAFHDV